MELATFLKDLLDQGIVTVAGQISVLEEEDLRASAEILEHYYQEDILEMPYAAPGFSATAAIWGARYVYHSIQFIMLRNLDEAVIETCLKEYPDEITPQAIYSIDLTFRYLADLHHLAKGLSPDDVLVKYLNKTALQWPFSSVGIELSEDIDHENIFAHPSLKYKYADRIIQLKDMKRARNKDITELIIQALGAHTASLWPELEIFIKTNI